MSNLNEELDRLLADFETRDKPFYEVSIVDAIRKIRGTLVGGERAAFRIQAESMAFGFCEDYSDKAEGWGTYFGPFCVLKNEVGQMVESPSIQLVTPETLVYWSERADQVKHPKLRARYADLVWDFSKRVAGDTAHVRFAQIVIDANLQIAAGDYCAHRTEVHTKLARALSLALSISDSHRLEQVRSAILTYAERTTDDPGESWAFAFEELIENRKVPLTVKEEQTIIEAMEQQLERTSGGAEPRHVDPHAAETGAMLLKRYYQKLERTDDVHRVLRLFGRAHLHWAEKAAPFLGAVWLKKVFEVYHEHGMKADADVISDMLREMSGRAADDMKTSSAQFTIPKSEIDAFLFDMTKGTVNEILQRIAVEFVPNLDAARAQLKTMASKSPFIMHVKRGLQDKHGRVVAEVGPFHSDPEGHLVLQLSQSIQFMNVFLRMTMEATISGHTVTVEALEAHLFESPLFDSSDHPLIRSGLEAYFAGNCAIAVHMLVPRIEAALRNLIRFAGGAVYRPDKRRGGLLLRNLDDLLRDPKTIECLTERVTRYFQVLLADPRGLNIRNDVCHGLADSGAFVPAMADRVLHVMLVLSLIGVQEKQEEAAA